MTGVMRMYYFVIFIDNGRLEVANKYFIEKTDAQDYARTIAQSRCPIVVKATKDAVY